MKKLSDDINDIALKHLRGSKFDHDQKRHAPHSAFSNAVTGQPFSAVAYRGVGSAPSDPGDAGEGTYYSSSKAVASSYGKPVRLKVVLQNPYVFSNENELSSAIDKFGTLRGGLAQRTLASRRMTKYYKRKGHDGLIYPGWDGPEGTYSVVVFPKDEV